MRFMKSAASHTRACTIVPSVQVSCCGRSLRFRVSGSEEADMWMADLSVSQVGALLRFDGAWWSFNCKFVVLSNLVFDQFECASKPPNQQNALPMFHAVTMPLP